MCIEKLLVAEELTGDRVASTGTVAMVRLSKCGCQDECGVPRYGPRFRRCAIILNSVTALAEFFVL